MGENPLVGCGGNLKRCSGEGSRRPRQLLGFFSLLLGFCFRPRCSCTFQASSRVDTRAGLANSTSEPTSEGGTAGNRGTHARRGRPRARMAVWTIAPIHFVPSCSLALADGLRTRSVPVFERPTKAGELLPYPPEGQDVGINPPGFCWTPHDGPGTQQRRGAGR